MGKHRYGLVFDAGSSGTRVYVYRWKNADAARASDDDDDVQRLPKIKTKNSWIKKTKPGVSTFGEKPEMVGPDHLQELIDFAQGIVPPAEIPNTPIFLLATAGMRLLPDDQRAAVLENVCSYFQRNTDFQLPDCDLHVQVIPGETEGLYGWIAANYLLGGFDAPDKHDHGKNHHTYGFLDMGGASAQIAFAPNSTEVEKHAEDLKLLRLRRVDGKELEYRVFVTTWLGFGANEARKRYVEHLLDASPNELELPDPCLPKGLVLTTTGEEIESGSDKDEVHLLGTGEFTQCLSSTYPLLEKDKQCTNPPCLLNGVHTPAIDFDINHFVGVSEFWHTTHGPFADNHDEVAYDFHTYQKQVTDFCSLNWESINDGVDSKKWGKKVDARTAEEVCFKASWLINVLHDGIGVPRLGHEPVKQPGSGWSNKTTAVLDQAKDKGFLDPFHAVDEIDGKEVSWTLGKMVLYASSQMPPRDDALAVGFGSNVADTVLPTDFQSAGGRYESLPGDLDNLKVDDDDDDNGDDWHDHLLSGNYSRRIPGILIVLLILTLAVYLLCGRERRTTLYHKVLTMTGRRYSGSRSKRKPYGGKFFGNVSPTYERVLEEAADPDEFELSDVSSERHSDSSNGPLDFRSGRTSGMATPAVRGLSPDFSRTSPKNKGYFDNTLAPGNPHGLGITPFERGGLIERSESRDRLAPRSRRGSPTRNIGKSPLISPFKESVD